MKRISVPFPPSVHQLNLVLSSKCVGSDSCDSVVKASEGYEFDLGTAERSALDLQQQDPQPSTAQIYPVSTVNHFGLPRQPSMYM